MGILLIDVKFISDCIRHPIKKMLIAHCLGALNFFISSINTLCNKTMEDTLSTVKAYETARFEENPIAELQAKTDACVQRRQEIAFQFYSFAELNTMHIAMKWR